MFYIFYSIILIAEVIIQFKFQEEILLPLEIAEYRKSALTLILSANNSAMMLLIYYIGRSQQEKDKKIHA
jgi:hypothetical protein